MDIQVNKNQLERVVIKWLNIHYGNLTLKKHKGYPNLILYVDSNDNMVMEYDKENEWIFIDYGRIWLILELLFRLKPRETKSILGHWLDKSYDLRGVMPLDSRQ
jgi:hypothetical protein